MNTTINRHNLLYDMELYFDVFIITNIAKEI